MDDRIILGDVRRVLPTLPSSSVQCVVTSPPYFGLRDYGVDGQIGIEGSIDGFLAELASVFHQVKRILSPDGVLWLNIGDTYNQDSPIRRSATEKRRSAPITLRRRCESGRGRRRKALYGVPWLLASALADDGWYVRAEIIWAKPAVLPDFRAEDRPDRSHETVFLFAKQAKYRFDKNAVGGFGSVWTIPVVGYDGHHAVMPEELAARCILSGSRPGDVVLDPFCGSGTVPALARRHGRRFVGIDVDPASVSIAEARIAGERQPVLWTSLVRAV